MEKMSAAVEFIKKESKICKSKVK